MFKSKNKTNIEGVFKEISNYSNTLGNRIITNVSVNKDIIPNMKYGKNGFTFIEGSLKNKDRNFKISLKITNKILKSNYPPGSYNFSISGAYISDFGSVIATVEKIEKIGKSEKEVIEEGLLQYCKKKGYLKRKKKKLPTIIKDIVCLTSRGSNIKGDIISNTGLPADHVRVYNCYDGKEIAKKIRANQDTDTIVLYRGGHEDPNMSIFSEKEVLDAIVSSKVPVCAALGHDVDQPFVYKIADKTYSAPSSFGKSIQQHAERRTFRELKMVVLILVLIAFYFYLN